MFTTRFKLRRPSGKHVGKRKGFNTHIHSASVTITVVVPLSVPDPLASSLLAANHNHCKEQHQSGRCVIRSFLQLRTPNDLGTTLASASTN
eukprot:364557-Chlamydomonas_euryale.AAC.22